MTTQIYKPTPPEARGVVAYSKIYPGKFGLKSKFFLPLIILLSEIPIMLKSKFNSSNKWTWQFSRFQLRLLTLLCRIEKHESLARLGSSLLNLLWVVAALSSHFALTARGSGVPVWLRKAGFVRNCFSGYTIPGLKDWVSCQLLVFCYFWNFLAVFSPLLGLTLNSRMHSLNQTNFDDFDVDNAFSHFYNHRRALSRNTLLWTLSKRKLKQFSKPWMTSGLKSKKSMKVKKPLFQ